MCDTRRFGRTRSRFTRDTCGNRARYDTRDCPIRFPNPTGGELKTPPTGSISQTSIAGEDFHSRPTARVAWRAGADDYPLCQTRRRPHGARSAAHGNRWRFQTPGRSPIRNLVPSFRASRPADRRTPISSVPTPRERHRLRPTVNVVRRDAWTWTLYSNSKVIPALSLSLTRSAPSTDNLVPIIA
jgi:hypothetical protein